MGDAPEGSGNWVLRALASGKDPRLRITALIDVAALLGGYSFVYVYQSYVGLEIPLLGVEALVTTPLVGLILLPLIHYLFVLPDPLQRSPSSAREIRFFQSEFPSRYLLQRCDECVEDASTCKNFLSSSTGAFGRIWFNDIFHGAIEMEDSRAVTTTFTKGYTCKLVFFMKRTLLVFFGLGIVAISLHHLQLWWQDALRLDLDYWQLLFPVVVLLLWVVLHRLHRADPDEPSGCWHAWREINRFHVAWMKDHEAELVDIVCRRSGGTKHFRTR